MGLVWVIVFQKKWTKILLVFTVLNISAYAQVLSETEFQTENDELGFESNEFDEDVNYKRRNKVSIYDFLNDIELSSIYLSEKQRVDLMNHLVFTGEFKDLLELQSIPSFKYYDYKRLRNIININDENQLTKSNIKIQNRTVYQSEIIKNANGSHWGNYQQYKLNLSTGLKLGLAREYDPGENSTQKYIYNTYDHYSFYIIKSWKNTELCLGSFQLYQGFGLLLGQGYSNSFGNGGINNLIQHRWNGNASQTEFNYFQGSYFRKQYKSLNLTIAYSHQKIDSGNTYGYHRTNNEISKKNKEQERVLLFGLERNSRKLNNSIILLRDIEQSSFGFSQASQFYYRNLISFYEFSFIDNKTAYSIGLMLLTGKDIQISISQTHFDYGYSSRWSSIKTQSFSADDGDGIILNILLPHKKKWILSYTHRLNYSTKIDEKNLGKSSDNTDIIRFDRLFSKEIKLSFILQMRYDKTDGNDAGKIYSELISYKGRIALKNSTQENISQEIQYYFNNNNIQNSNGIAYQVKIKSGKIKYNYSIGLFDIKSGLPLYFSSDNYVQGRQTLGVFSTGYSQSVGFQLKLFKKISLSTNIIYNNETIEKDSSLKLLTNLRYP